jgi:hypothetical protein
MDWMQLTWDVIQWRSVVNLVIEPLENILIDKQHVFYLVKLGYM